MSSMGLQRQAATGFYECVCPICKRDDKITGGVKFEGDSIIMNCFRASCDASCVLTKGEPVSKKFRRLMDEIGVKIPADIRMVKNSFQKKLEKELEKDLFVKHSFERIEPQCKWRKINRTDTFWIEYFQSRKCDPFEIFIIEDGWDEGKPAIPFYFYNKLIGYQILSLDGPVKYLAYSGDNTATMLINGGVIERSPIIVDGTMDALCFPNTTGILGKRIKKEQAYFFIDKDPIIFPERRGGMKLFQQAREYGWRVVVPPWDSVKDLNDCVVKYGLVSTARMIAENTYTDYNKADIAFGLWSKESVKRRSF